MTRMTIAVAITVLFSLTDLTMGFEGGSLLLAPSEPVPSQKHHPKNPTQHHSSDSTHPQVVHEHHPQGLPYHYGHLPHAQPLSMVNEQGFAIGLVNRPQQYDPWVQQPYVRPYAGGSNVYRGQPHRYGQGFPRQHGGFRRSLLNIRIFSHNYHGPLIETHYSPQNWNDPRRYRR